MISFAALVLINLVPVAPTLDGVSNPTDVRGYLRGVRAAGLDPAATAFADGVELELRHRVVGGDASYGQLGLYGLAPFGKLTLFGGYDWLDIPKIRSQRGTAGVALRLDERFSAGISYRAIRSPEAALTGSTWNASLFSEASSWLSWSLGVEGLNSPRLGELRYRPSYLVGVGLRPLRGSPWVTVGLQGGYRVIDDRYHLALDRAVLDLGPIDGLHGLIGYAPVPGDADGGGDGGELWAGLSVEFGGLEVRAVGLAAGHGVAQGSQGSQGGVAATIRSKPNEDLLPDAGRTVEYALSGDLMEEADSLFASRPRIPLATIHLERIAADQSVAEVILHIGELKVGLATIDELRRAVQRLRSAGKKVTANIWGADDKSYMVAAACDKIRIDPIGTVNIDGLALSIHYLADALDKVGVRFDAVGIGKYKTGPDSLTRNKPRPEETEVQEEILAQARELLVKVLVEDRGLTEEVAFEVLGRGIFPASEALERGLVDELSSPTDPTELPSEPLVAEPWPREPRPSRLWSQRPVIQVVPIVGTIVTRDGGNPLPGPSAVAGQIIQQLDAAQRDRDVVAVVLRINSPGGEILASDLIWRAVRTLAERKPVVVSMGDVAASGGYYVAAPAGIILAEPNTITGSIGIYWVKPDVKGLLEMLGVHTQVYKTHPHADRNMWTRPLDESDRQRMRRTLSSMYDGFVGKVAAGRALNIEKVRELAEGRVYTGTQAKEVGLVDRIGGLTDAIDEARSRAGLPADADFEIKVPSRSFSLGSLLSKRLVQAEGEAPLVQAITDLVDRIQAFNGKVLALMPFVIEVQP